MSDQPEFDLETVFAVDDYLYFYSEMLTPEVTDRQVNFLVERLGLSPRTPVLDLACGFGRHANRLASLGIPVVGIDYMEGFLELARQDAALRGVAVDYRQGDMRRIDFQAEFDCVLLLFTAFGYFSDEENLKVLENIARALVPGGHLVFDIQNRDVFLKGYQPDRVMEKEGNLMIDRHTFDSETGRLVNRRIVIRDGVRRDKPFSIRMYNPSELRELLPKAGLEVEQMLGGYDGTPVSGDSRRLVVIARKPGP